jgi:hypothetical protein
MSNWAKNDQVLTRRFPETARRIRSVSAASDSGWLSSRESEVVVSYWLEGQSWKEGVFFAVSGLGDGNHVAALL